MKVRGMERVRELGLGLGKVTVKGWEKAKVTGWVMVRAMEQVKVMAQG